MTTDDRRWTLPYFADLAGDFRVFAPDLPGFGRTPPLPQPAWPAYAAWVAAFCDAVEVDQDLTVAGNSMGAAVARFFAAAYPARGARLVRVDGSRPLQIAPSWPGCWRCRGSMLSPCRFLVRWATTDASMRRYIATRPT